MASECWPSSAERLLRYRKYAKDAYAKARKSVDPAERDDYIAMAERWEERANWQASEPRARKEPTHRRIRLNLTT